MGRRVGTVRLGVIFGGGDASPFRLQLELAPFTPAFDAPPVFEVAQGLPPPLARWSRDIIRDSPRAAPRRSLDAMRALAEFYAQLLTLTTA